MISFDVPEGARARVLVSRLVAAMLLPVLAVACLSLGSILALWLLSVRKRAVARERTTTLFRPGMSGQEYARLCKRFLDDRLDKEFPNLTLRIVGGGGKALLRDAFTPRPRRLLVFALKSPCPYGKIDFEFYSAAGWKYAESDAAIILLERHLDTGYRETIRVATPREVPIAECDWPLEGWLGRIANFPVSYLIDCETMTLTDWFIHPVGSLEQFTPTVLPDSDREDRWLRISSRHPGGASLPDLL